jgi:hypothetical protein
MWKLIVWKLAFAKPPSQGTFADPNTFHQRNHPAWWPVGGKARRTLDWKDDKQLVFHNIEDRVHDTK